MDRPKRSQIMRIRPDVDSTRYGSDQMWIQPDLDPTRFGSDQIWIRPDLDLAKLFGKILSSQL